MPKRLQTEIAFQFNVLLPTQAVALKTTMAATRGYALLRAFVRSGNVNA